MNDLRRKAARLLGAALVTATGAGLASLASGGSTAHADPSFATSFAGVGADTGQDLFDAYSGADPAPAPTSGGSTSATKFYTPLSSSASTGDLTISSWDALPVGGVASQGYCVTTKLGGPSFDRPNGSTAGINALIDANNSTGWEATQASDPSCTNAPVSVVGQIDFARSARGPKTTGGNLTFIPYARDAIAYAYYDDGDGNTDLPDLTTAQLEAIYTSASGSASIGGDTVDACLPTETSAVATNFEKAIGASATQAEAASTASGCGLSIQQNNGDQFYTFASTLPAGTDAVIPFSVGSWISQNNGVALDLSATARTAGVTLGAANSVSPYEGTGTSLTPNPTYYSNALFGVSLYVVVPTTSISGIDANLALESLFVGSSSAICSTAGQDEAVTYGLEDASNCGITSDTGDS